jgi:hypothetical protein
MASQSRKEELDRRLEQSRRTTSDRIGWLISDPRAERQLENER